MLLYTGWSHFLRQNVTQRRTAQTAAKCSVKSGFPTTALSPWNTPRGPVEHSGTFIMLRYAVMSNMTLVGVSQEMD